MKKQEKCKTIRLRLETRKLVKNDERRIPDGVKNTKSFWGYVTRHSMSVKLDLHVSDGVRGGTRSAQKKRKC